MTWLSLIGWIIASWFMLSIGTALGLGYLLGRRRDQEAEQRREEYADRMVRR